MVSDLSGVITCLRKSIFAITRFYTYPKSEFFTLTSHPKTPDRTAAEAGRHVSRNIHNTGNFAASREKTGKGDCGDCDTAAADLQQI